jgi:hypothetical protein
MLMANVCVLLLSNARPLFINPPTKESGTILKFGTLSSHNANNAASRSASITSERSRTVLGLSRFDQFLERVQTFDIHPSIHTQHLVFSLPKSRSILKAIGISPALKRKLRPGCAITNSRLGIRFANRFCSTHRAALAFTRMACCR